MVRVNGGPARLQTLSVTAVMYRPELLSTATSSLSMIFASEGMAPLASGRRAEPVSTWQRSEHGCWSVKDGQP